MTDILHAIGFALLTTIVGGFFFGLVVIGVLSSSEGEAHIEKHGYRYVAISYGAVLGLIFLAVFLISL